MGSNRVFIPIPFRWRRPRGCGHFTNRSPYALFHFLRVSHVEEAIEKHPDTLNIPKANAERLRALGHDQVAKIWRNILDL